MTTPLDVIKTLLQTQVEKQSKSFSSMQAATVTPSTTKVPHYHYNGILEGLHWNYKHYGIRALFSGLWPRVAWTAMQSGMMFVIYEQVLELLEKMSH